MIPNLTDADYKLLNNEEFKEAHQTNVTQSSTQEYHASIGQEYLDKYNYVDQVCADLQAKGIRVIIYAALPSPGYEDSEAFYYFHNWYSSQEFVNGRSTRESMLKTSRYNHMHIQAFMNWFMQYICRVDDVRTILSSLWTIYGGAANWWKTGKTPEYVLNSLSDQKKDS